MEMTLHSHIREESKASKAVVLTVREFLTRFSVTDSAYLESVLRVKRKLYIMRNTNATHCFMVRYVKLSTQHRVHTYNNQDSNPYLGVEVVSG
jgi:hypothetical protein